MPVNGGVLRQPIGHEDAHAVAFDHFNSCLLYTSDAADERSSVDLGGRRIIKKKTYKQAEVNIDSQNWN